VLSSLITLAIVWALARRLGGQRVGLIALGLAGISPFLIWYGQFARNYSLWIMGSALTLLCLWRAWQRPEQLTRWLPYVLTAALTGYVFYLEAFLFVAHNAFALTHLMRTWPNLRDLRTWVIVQLALGALLAPWYLRSALFANSQQYDPNAHAANPLWGLQAFSLGDMLPATLQATPIFDPSAAVSVASVLALLIVLGAIVMAWLHADRKAVWFVCWPSLVPLGSLSLLAAATGRGYFHPRYIAANAVPIVLLLALGLGTLMGKDHRDQYTAWRVGAAATVLLLILGFNVVALRGYHFDPQYAKGPDWISIMALLSAQAEEGDLVIHNYPDPAFGYYFDHYYSGEASAIIQPAQANPSPQEVADSLASLASQHDQIWFMPVRSPYWDGGREVLRWLEAEQQHVSDQWVGVIRVMQFADWQAQSHEINHPQSAVFGEAVELAGYNLTPRRSAWSAGETVHLELFWRPLQTSDLPLTAFVHLVGPAGPDGSPLWAQDDHPPQQGRVDSRTWQSEWLLRDSFSLTIPPDAPLGRYQVLVGWYDAASGARLLVDEGPLDSHLLFSLELSP
ncbi:MAG: hypothetical protein GYB68_02630, partial [Chloroflexi bacterium]|nr:hypothetical protein [Chloroflexota bacterium]